MSTRVEFFPTPGGTEFRLLVNDVRQPVDSWAITAPSALLPPSICSIGWRRRTRLGGQRFRACRTRCGRQPVRGRGRRARAAPTLGSRRADRDLRHRHQPGVLRIAAVAPADGPGDRGRGAHWRLAQGGRWPPPPLLGAFFHCRSRRRHCRRWHRSGARLLAIGRLQNFCLPQPSRGQRRWAGCCRPSRSCRPMPSPSISSARGVHATGPDSPSRRRHQFDPAARSPGRLCDRQFNQFAEARPIYTLPGGRFVVLAPTLRRALNEVRKRQSSTAAVKRALMAAPRAVLRAALEDPDDPTLVDRLDSLFVETPAYSDRVTGLGIWTPRVLPWIQRVGSDCSVRTRRRAAKHRAASSLATAGSILARRGGDPARTGRECDRPWRTRRHLDAGWRTAGRGPGQRGDPSRAHGTVEPSAWRPARPPKPAD